MSDRGARRLHILLMGWLTLTFTAAWLPFVRGAMDGASYEWGTSHFGMAFGGTGMGGDYWFAAAKAAVALAFLWAGWRRPNGPFRLVLLLWLALRLADTLYAVIAAPGDFRIQGDTLGMDISLAAVAPALDGAMLFAAFWWLLKAPALPVPPFGRANIVLLAIFVLLLPVQYWLLSSGSGQDTNDVVGVLLTIAGWVLLSIGLGRRRGNGREALPAQMV